MWMWKMWRFFTARASQMVPSLRATGGLLPGHGWTWPLWDLNFGPNSADGNKRGDAPLVVIVFPWMASIFIQIDSILFCVPAVGGIHWEIDTSNYPWDIPRNCVPRDVQNDKSYSLHVGLNHFPSDQSNTNTQIEPPKARLILVHIKSMGSVLFLFPMQSKI